MAGVPLGGGGPAATGRAQQPGSLRAQSPWLPLLVLNACLPPCRVALSLTDAWQL